MTDIRYVIEMTFAPRATEDQFEEFVDAVVEHLEALNRELNVAARLDSQLIEFAGSTMTADFQMAVAGVLVDIRTALHAAGCRTAEWPRFEAMGHSIRQLQGA